jgi:hypothetical protein
MTPLTFFRLSLILPFVIPLGNLPPTIFGAMIILAIKYSGVAYALTIPLLWWLLGRCHHMREFRRVVLLAPILCGALWMAGGGLLFAVGCGLGVWGQGMALCSEMSTSLLLAILLMGAVIVFAYMCALLILVGSALAVWLRIVKPPVAA